MIKNKDRSAMNSYLGIFIYYILPRTQIVTASSLINSLFYSRELLVPVITLLMINLTFKNSPTGQWRSLTLTDMLIWAYVFYFLASLFFVIILEFI